MSTLQARHRGHNIPDGVTTFNEIEYDREGGVFLNRTKLVLLAVIVFLLIAFAAFVGRYTAMRQFRQVRKSVGVPYLEYVFRIEKLKQNYSLKLVFLIPISILNLTRPMTLVPTRSL